MYVSMKYLCGPRPHIVDRGTCIVHRLWVQWQNIRRVVVGACKWSYEAQMGAMGCDRLGVTDMCDGVTTGMDPMALEGGCRHR